ncbi:UNVERIFIED_CONTAM: hypothetical protein GTU68_036243 [Idotea baltica]|nr:hypothetical protein [Idotea baltica]
MISLGTRLKVIDNSGARIVECIKILGDSKKKVGTAGQQIIVSVKKVNPSKKMRKGEIHRAVIVGTKKTKLRLNGIGIAFDSNSTVLINIKGIPLGTRVLAPVMLEVREQGFLKVISMATSAI